MKRTTALSVIAQSEIGQMTMLQLRVLAAVAVFPDGRVETPDLLAALSASSAGTSKAVDYLVNSGFLLRREHEENRRRNVLAITPLGRDTIDQLAQALIQASKPN
jgi:DNA-binding MarR family transcriptional regulator